MFAINEGTSSKYLPENQEEKGWWPHLTRALCTLYTVVHSARHSSILHYTVSTHCYYTLAALHCTTLHCNILHYTALHFTSCNILHYIALWLHCDYTTLHCTAQHCIILDYSALWLTERRLLNVQSWAQQGGQGEGLEPWRSPATPAYPLYT